MPPLEPNNRAHAVAESGLLENFSRWDDRVARDLATTEGITETTDERWRLVRHLRAYDLEFNIATMLRKLRKESGIKLDRVYELLPSGPANGACKVAGLPKPAGCV